MRGSIELFRVSLSRFHRFDLLLVGLGKDDLAEPDCPQGDKHERPEGNPENEESGAWMKPEQKIGRVQFSMAQDDDGVNQNQLANEEKLAEASVVPGGRRRHEAG